MVSGVAKLGLGLAALVVVGLVVARLLVGALALLVRFGGLVLVGFLIAYALYELRCRLRGG